VLFPIFAYLPTSNVIMKHTPTAIHARAAVLIAVLLSLAACEPDGKKKSEGTLSLDTTSADAGNVQKLIYGLPSPAQGLSLLKSSGARYEPKLLNPDGNAANYQSSTKAAMNIGVYGTDLAYTNTFDRSQESVRYFIAIQRLGDQLGISNVFDDKVISRVEKNKSNQDSIIAIFSSQFTRANTLLKKNNQEDYARFIIVGGWVEGLYIASEIYKLTPKPEIGKRIAEQKSALETLLLIAEPSKGNAEFAPIYKGLKELEAAYAPIEISYSLNETKPAEAQEKKAEKGKKKTIHISNSSEAKYTPEQLQAVHAKVAVVRKAVIQ